MSGQIAVSVIIPVYNVAPYIGRCIESLQAQTLPGLEFIFVDDCSTDGSIAVVEGWAARDERVHIIRNEENLGAGPSRNSGIEAARGDYLAFVDSDDYVSLDFFECLYATAIAGGGHDIAKGVTQRMSITGEVIGASSIRHNDKIARRLKKGIPLFRSFTYGHWTALYKRELFEDGLVRYGTARNGEDGVFLLKCCYRTDDIVFSQDAVYHYVINRADSAEHADIEVRLFNKLEMFGEELAFFSCEELDGYALRHLWEESDKRITRYFIHMQDNNKLARRLPEYRRRYKELVEQLPTESLERFLAHSPAYSALKDWGVLLPSANDAPQWQGLGSIRPWLGYALRHPTRENLRGCVKAVAGYAKRSLKGELGKGKRSPEISEKGV